MKFLNKRTGAVIDVPCRLEGPDWTEVTEAEKAEPKPKAAAAKAGPEETPAKAAPKKKTVKKG